MKKIMYLALIMLFVIILAACAKATPQSANGMINPGDKIGDFLIVKGDGEDVVYVWEPQLDCGEEQGGSKPYSCTVNTGVKMNVSWGVYDDSFSGKLDEIWSNHTYKMFINDRPVNLEAFGSIDVVHPKVGNMRHWNVVIITDKPGEITVHSEGKVQGEPFGDTKIFTFKSP